MTPELLAFLENSLNRGKEISPDSIEALFDHIQSLQSTVDVLTAAIADLRYESSAYRRGVEDGREAMRLRWTNEVPTVPGWYWWRRLLNHTPIVLGITEFDSMQYSGLSGNYPIYNFGEWAGPVLPPGNAQ